MKILVTGSNGCVGSALKKIVSNNNDWVFISRSDCDLTDRNNTIDLFKNVLPDYVVHLAAYVPGFYNIDKVSSFKTNVRINENVLEAAHNVNVKNGLFCLSANMISDTQSSFPINESLIFDGQLSGPFAGYSYSKRMLAMQCVNYNEQYGRKYFGIIPCNIYGPEDNFSSGRLIPNLIKKFKEAKLNNSDVIINGSGLPLRQFIYSYDLARIINYLVDHYHSSNNVICSSDEEISIKELSKIISSLFDFKGQIFFDTSKTDGIFKKTLDNSYLKSIIPNFQFTNLKDGLITTISNMENI